MNGNTETALIVVVALLAICAAWYYFSKQACTASTTCPSGQVCTNGYCQKPTSS